MFPHTEASGIERPDRIDVSPPFQSLLIAPQQGTVLTGAIGVPGSPGDQAIHSALMEELTVRVLPGCSAGHLQRAGHGGDGDCPGPRRAGHMSTAGRRGSTS